MRACLTAAEIPFELDTGIVRGLDYYTRTVFEFVSDALGAQAVAEQLALRVLAAAVQPVDRNQLRFSRLFHQFSLSSLLTTISRYCVFEISTSRGFCPSGALTKPRASMMSMIFAARP